MFLKTKNLFIVAILLACSAHVNATETYAANLTISKIRAVGDYSDSTFSNAVEIWLREPAILPSNMRCPATAYRMFIDAKHKHIISAAYLAFSHGKKITVAVDDRLPIRGDGCEVSVLEVIS